MNASNSVSLKILVCAAASMALTVGFSWSFVESTCRGLRRARQHEPQHERRRITAVRRCAPFAAAVPGRSATLLG